MCITQSMPRLLHVSYRPPRLNTIQTLALDAVRATKRDPTSLSYIISSLSHWHAALVANPPNRHSTTRVSKTTLAPAPLCLLHPHSSRKVRYQRHNHTQQHRHGRTHTCARMHTSTATAQPHPGQSRPRKAAAAPCIARGVEKTMLRESCVPIISGAVARAQLQALPTAPP